MKSLLMVLSFVGFASVASADDVLVNCYERESSDIRTITVVENNLGEFVATVVMNNHNFWVYKVDKVPAMLPGEYYASLFDTFKFKGVNGDFQLDLCVSAGCSQQRHDARPGKVVGYTLDQAQTKYGSETLNCVSSYTSLSK